MKGAGDALDLNASPAPTPAAARRAVISGAGLAYGLTRPSILALMVIGAALHIVVTFDQAASRTAKWDFSHYYLAALAMREGVNPYTADLRPLGNRLGLEGIERATDTPFFLLCFEPLTLLKPALAYWLWFIINLAALVLALRLILLEVPQLATRQLVSLIAIVILYPPVSNHFYYAQSQILLLLLLACMLRALRMRREPLAGLALAGAVLFKVFPLTVAGYLVVCRRWWALTWVLTGIIAGTVAPIIFFGFSRTAGFLRGIRLTTDAGFLARPANVAIGSFVSRAFWYAAGALSLNPWLEGARIAAVALAEVLVVVLTVFATLAQTRRERSDEVSAATDRGRAFALWLVAAIMLSPTAWIHYLVLLVLPFMLIAAGGWNGSASARSVWLMAASYALLSVSIAIAGATHRSLVKWPKVTTMLEESATLSLLLAYASVWFFALDGSPSRERTDAVHTVDAL